MGGGITILKIQGYLCEDRIKNMLFKIKPQLEGKVQGITLIKFMCSECLEERIIGWVFEQNGEIKKIAAATICNDCHTNKLSFQTTTELEEKRVCQLISNWWYINESESYGFKNYNRYNNITQHAWERALAYTQMFSQKSLVEKNLLFMGSTGTGKTHLVKAIARTLNKRNFKVGYIEAAELFNKIRESYNNGSTNRLFADLRSLDLLVIDDVGVETIKPSEVSWTVKTWTQIIEARLEKSNIWTTNLDDAGLPLIIGERAASRMYEGTRIIDIYTDDYRKKMVIQ